LKQLGQVAGVFRRGFEERRGGERELARRYCPAVTVPGGSGTDALNAARSGDLDGSLVHADDDLSVRSGSDREDGPDHRDPESGGLDYEGVIR
jgi:hypothetical protein